MNDQQEPTPVDSCPTCCGEGVIWDRVDGVYIDIEGERETCPDCGGSGIKNMVDAPKSNP